MSRLVLLAVAFGILAGRFGSGDWQIPGWLESAAFAVMLFGVGLELGQDKSLWQRLRRGGWKMLLFPVNVIVGSWIGGMVGGFLLGLSVPVSLAVVSGFGWYSLAAILINQMNGPQLAAVAFIANVLRELITLLTIPWVARWASGFVAVSFGGATSMDTTLAALHRYTSRETSLYGFVSGVITSLLVPVFIPLCLQL